MIESIYLYYQDREEHLFYFLIFANILSERYDVTISFSDSEFYDECLKILNRYNIFNHITINQVRPKDCRVIDLKPLDNSYGFSNIIYKFFYVAGLEPEEFNLDVDISTSESKEDYYVFHINKYNDLNFNYRRFIQDDLNYNELLGFDFIKGKYLFIGEESDFLLLRNTLIGNNFNKDQLIYDSSSSISDVLGLISKSKGFIGNPVLYMSISQYLRDIPTYGIFSSNLLFIKIKIP